MENATMNCPLEDSVLTPDEIALNPDDGEVFQRVWKRVMPEEADHCPIEVRTTANHSPVEVRATADHCPVEVRTTIVGGDLPCTCVHSHGEEAVEAPSMPPALGDAQCPHREGDFPDISQVQKLGPGSCVYGAMLQRQAMDALEAWQLYRNLARRSTGKSARSLSTLASEKHHAARRLAAAYFLISGVRYWPVDRLSTPRTPSYLGTIRQAYQAEQRREQAYLMSAAETTDEALQELYQDLSVQSGGHGRVLRSILEQGL